MLKHYWRHCNMLHKRLLILVLTSFLISFVGDIWAASNNMVTNDDPQVGTKARGTYFKAILLDSLTKEPIEFATLSAKYIGETQPKKYALSDTSGVVVIEGLPVGRATIRFEYIGYKTKSITYDVKKGANEYGEFLVSADINLLEAAVVSGVGNQIMIKKDTIEYNASSFKVNDTDMLEELIKKLPGVEIDSDGKITANGKEINKVMIDGKTFFLDDPTLATKNLPAKIVEKVRIVERKSDQARFTGIDDGEEETVLDLGIKNGMMQGWFGNLMGGYGTEDRFQSAAMVGRFTKKTQISIIGNGNNTNNRGFMDMAGSMMGNMRPGGFGGGGGGFFGGGRGVTTSWMGGLNANTEAIEGAMKLSGNALYSGSEVEMKEMKEKETMLSSGVSMITKENSSDITNTDGFRFGGEMDYSISDNTSILFRPNINIGSGSFDSMRDFSTVTGADSTNRGFSKSYGDNNNERIGGMLLWRQRLGKPGRTLSLRTEYSYSNNEITGFNYSETNYFDQNIVDSISVIDQMYTRLERTNSASARFSYTEPLGKNFFVEGAYRYGYSKSHSVKDTYDKDGAGDYTVKDVEYSTDYENVFINQRVELNFMKQEKKYNLTVGANLVPSTTKSMGRTKDTTYSVVNFAPSARLDYRFTDDKFLRIRYRGRTNQPSLNQLLPIADNSDPLRLTVGNDKLNPEFTHSLGVEYNTNNRKTFSWFSVGLNASYTSNKIISMKYYTPEGVQISTYDNTDKGVFSTNARVMFNSRIAKSNFSVSSFSNIRYGNGVSYVSQNRDFIENITETLSVSENLRLTYRNDWIELIGGARASYQNAWYSVSSLSKKATWSNSVTGSMNITIPGGFNVTSDIEHFYYIGYEDGYNEPSTVWNAEVSKTLFKNSATFKIRIYDILKDAKNTYKVMAEDYSQTVRNNTLGQYVMFSLVWRFGNFGGMRNGGFRGGPGGHRGPGGFRR